MRGVTAVAATLVVALAAGCPFDGSNPRPGPTCEAYQLAPFIQMGADYRRVQFPSGAITVDASASYDINCEPLTFTWSMTVPEGSTVTLDVSNPEIVKFTPDRDGPYEVWLALSDGIGTTIRSVYVGVHLPAKPIAVSVSPDGKKAAVTQYHQFSVVDLEGGTVIATYSPALTDFTYDGGDVLLYDDAWAFVFPAYEFATSPMVVKLADGTATRGALGADAEGDAHVKPRLDAARDHVFALGAYTDGIRRFTASAGAVAYDGPPGLGSIELSTGPFLAADDGRIYTGSGHVISTTDLTQTDTLLQGGDPLPFLWVADSIAAGKVVVVTNDIYGADAFRVYDRDTLQLLERHFHPAMFDLGSIATPRWAFWKADGSRYYVVGYASPKTGIATYTLP